MITIRITGGNKSSQQRSALRQLGIAINGQDPSRMVDSGSARHNGIVRANPDHLALNCDFAAAQSKLTELVADPANHLRSLHIPLAVELVGKVTK